jgi:hypothetical protein
LKIYETNHISQEVYTTSIIAASQKRLSAHSSRLTIIKNFEL